MPAPSIVSLKRYCSVALLSVAVSGCGGGSGGDSGSLAPTPTNQAMLGSLSGTQIRAYLAADPTTVITDPVIANNSGLPSPVRCLPGKRFLASNDRMTLPGPPPPTSA